jgi:hypothetical protein
MDIYKVTEDSSSSSSSSVPDDFGLENGTSISNKDTVLSEIDRVLGVSKAPDVEYFYVKPYCWFRIPFTSWGISYNSYGHAAVRYHPPLIDESYKDLSSIFHKSSDTLFQMASKW